MTASFFFFFFFFSAYQSNKWCSYAQNVLISLHNFYIIHFMIFFFTAHKKATVLLVFLGQEEAGIQFKHSAFEPPDSPP